MHTPHHTGRCAQHRPLTKITDIPTPMQAKKSVAMCKGSIPFI
nr:MAG TPA_asm: hypothetical protein [Caudoviricetes sp.]